MSELELLEVYSWIRDWEVEPTPLEAKEAEFALSLFFSRDSKRELDIELLVLYAEGGFSYRPIYSMIAKMYIDNREELERVIAALDSKELSLSVQSCVDLLRDRASDANPAIQPIPSRAQDEVDCCSEEGYNKPLRLGTLDWLHYYCKQIYVSETTGFRIPPSVIEDLSSIRKCQTYKLYRGLSFGIDNYSKYERLTESFTPDLSQTESYDTLMVGELRTSLPMSTSINRETALGFANRRIVPVLLEFDIDYKDVLVDLNLLVNNPSLLEYERNHRMQVFIREEAEVILHPGRYSYKVCEVETEGLEELFLDLSRFLDPMTKKSKRTGIKSVLSTRIKEGSVVGSGLGFHNPKLSISFNRNEESEENVDIWIHSSPDFREELRQKGVKEFTLLLETVEGSVVYRSEELIEIAIEIPITEVIPFFRNNLKTLFLPIVGEDLE